MTELHSNDSIIISLKNVQLTHFLLLSPSSQIRASLKSANCMLYVPCSPHLELFCLNQQCP